MNEDSIAICLYNICDSIASAAWLLIQYENARLSVARTGRFLTRKEFMEKPAYTVALQPMGLLTIIKAGIPHAMVAIQQSQPRPNLPGTNDRPLVIQ